jgi:hypothetical protein
MSVGTVSPERAEAEKKKRRRQIFQSLNGCDCPLDAHRDDKCTVRIVRCNGRLDVIRKRIAEEGL